MSLHAPTADDVDDIVRLFAVQERSWWGEVDGDADDVRRDVDRAVMAKGSLAEGGRLSLTLDGTIGGVGLHVGHGQTIVMIDPDTPMPDRHVDDLVGWLLASGATEIDTPSHDRERIAVLESHGLHPSRSSFELERPGPLDDLAGITWPDGGVAPSPFTIESNELIEEVHALIYSVWTDVEGHTDRPIDEWRSLFLGGPSFDPDLVVLLRRTDDLRLAGVAVCTIFNGEMGWVAQLAVGRNDRGIGLGRALLAESFRRLAERGIDRFGLGVEASNANALGLYRSVGLEITREWVHFEPITVA